MYKTMSGSCEVSVVVLGCGRSTQSFLEAVLATAIVLISAVPVFATLMRAIQQEH